jgi:cell division protein FtsI (penicillin-binding protein 3)
MTMWRQKCLSSFFILFLFIVVARLIFLHTAQKEFLQSQGKARMAHIINIPTYRGAIVDRRGEALAISTPKDAIVINPRHFALEATAPLAHSLKLPLKTLKEKIEKNRDRHFLYIKKDVHPDISRRINALHLPGVSVERSFRRYYPFGPDCSQVIGFTDIHDHGQSGIEFSFDPWLSPIHGQKRVLSDRAGHWVQDLEDLETAQAGATLTLSLDLRIQNLAQRELLHALKKTRAKSATLVMINIPTGEILAMITVPSFNPNNREERISAFARNRAVTDQFEPGSTLKPFTVLAALESGLFTPQTLVNTHPGYFFIKKNKVQDGERNLGNITLTEALLRSSNIAMSKIALTLDPATFIAKIARFGFGSPLSLGFPGEVSGRINTVKSDPFSLATLSFGYGLTVTPLHLAWAYATLGSHGLQRPLRLTPLTEPLDEIRVSDEKMTKILLNMLAKNTEMGAGKRAHIPGYRTAGKTGTIRINENGRYFNNRHIAFFTGVTPVTHPRLATVIMLEEPSEENHGYYGNIAAAPIYAKVVEGALHLLHVPPDSTESTLQ